MEFGKEKGHLLTRELTSIRAGYGYYSRDLEGKIVFEDSLLLSSRLHYGYTLQAHH